MSPFDPDCPKDLRIPALPTELFMVLRICTIIRGILSRFKCDVSAARVWEPYARRALERAGQEAPLPPRPEGQPWPASGASGADLAAEGEERERAESAGAAGAGPGSEGAAAGGAAGAGAAAAAVVVGGVKVHPNLLLPKARACALPYAPAAPLHTHPRQFDECRCITFRQQ